MTYEETSEVRVTMSQAIAELRSHGFEADQIDGGLVVDGDTLLIGADGCFSARTILNWLGY